MRSTSIWGPLRCWSIFTLRALREHLLRSLVIPPSLTKHPPSRSLGGLSPVPRTFSRDQTCELFRSTPVTTFRETLGKDAQRSHCKTAAPSPTPNTKSSAAQCSKQCNSEIEMTHPVKVAHGGVWLKRGNPWCVTASHSHGQTVCRPQSAPLDRNQSRKWALTVNPITENRNTRNFHESAQWRRRDAHGRWFVDVK